MLLKLLLTALPLAVVVSAFPQSGQDTAFVSTAIKNTLQLYRNDIGAQARLYNGSKYSPPQQTFEQHPYFLSVDWMEGDVYYDGELFRQVPLMLDLNNGQLITEHYSNGQSLQLVEDKVHHFIIAGHYFENIHNESVGNSLPASGFYEILYGGNTKVIVRRQKLIHDEIVNTVIERSFDVKNRYFILKDGIFHPVKTKASVLKLLENKKQQLKKFLRQNRLRFKENRESALKSLAEYYDALR